MHRKIIIQVPCHLIWSLFRTVFSWEENTLFQEVFWESVPTMFPQASDLAIVSKFWMSIAVHIVLGIVSPDKSPYLLWRLIVVA